MELEGKKSKNKIMTNLDPYFSPIKRTYIYVTGLLLSSSNRLSRLLRILARLPQSYSTSDLSAKTRPGLALSRLSRPAVQSRPGRYLEAECEPSLESPNSPPPVTTHHQPPPPPPVSSRCTQGQQSVGEPTRAQYW